jgi:hypothetical protein
MTEPKGSDDGRVVAPLARIFHSRGKMDTQRAQRVHQTGVRRGAGSEKRAAEAERDSVRASEADSSTSLSQSDSESEDEAPARPPLRLLWKPSAFPQGRAGVRFPLRRPHVGGDVSSPLRQAVASPPGPRVERVKPHASLTHSVVRRVLARQCGSVRPQERMFSKVCCAP